MSDLPPLPDIEDIPEADAAAIEEFRSQLRAIGRRRRATVADGRSPDARDRSHPPFND